MADFYVVRIPANGTGRNFIVESVAFVSLERAHGWGQHVQNEHPKDEVFVVEKKDLYDEA